MNRYNEFTDSNNPKEIKKGYETDKIDNIVISFLTLRRLIGYFGILLPIILLVGTLIYDSEILPSISHYYHSRIRDFFTGTIIVISTFLFAYRGEDKWENILCSIAAFSALILAIFPTENDLNVLKLNALYQKKDFEKFVPPSELREMWVNNIHFLSASLFFTTLIVLILWKFYGHEKKINNNSQIMILYKICGFGMLICITLIIIFKVLSPKDNNPFTFLFETIALIFFGIAWLIKGEAIKDLLSK